MNLSTLKQALYITPHRIPAADPLRLHAAGLLEVLAFVERRFGKPRSGVFKLQSHRLLYWPHLFEQQPVLQTLALRLFTPAELRTAPEAAGLEGYQRWCQWLHARVLFLLRGLALPVTAAEARPLQRMYEAAYHEAGLPDLPAYADARNYTVFRAIREHSTAAQRVACQPCIPYANVFANTRATPGALLALYAAWAAVTNRVADPFDPTEVGVEFASSGHLFINWELFGKSRFWPKHVPTARCEREVNEAFDEQRRLSGTTRRGPPIRCLRGILPPPANMPQHLRQLPRHCSLMAGLIDVDPDTAARRFGVERPLAAAALCQEMPTYHQHAAYTLLDPVLLLRANLFSGVWHNHHWRQSSTAVRQERKARARAGLLPLASSKLYTFTYRPADYLDDFLQEPGVSQLRRARQGAVDPEAETALANCPWHFANDFVETIYAVKKKGQLCFTVPRGIMAYEHEQEVWDRFLDLLYLEERARAYDGDLAVYEIERKTGTQENGLRSKYYQNMEEQLAYEVLEEDVRAMIVRGGSDAQEHLEKIEAGLRRAHQLERGGASTRWFFDRVLPAMTKSHLAPNQLRVKRTVLLPGAATPRLLPFFTDRTIQELKECTFLSMLALIQQKKPMVIALHHPLALSIQEHLRAASLRRRRAMTALPGAAPMLLAWARFCEEQGATSSAFSATQMRRQDRRARGEVGEWTLPQDVLFLTTYRRYPRLSPVEVQQLNDGVGRDETAWRLRMSMWRHRAPRLLHQSTMRRLHLGVRSLTDDDAWRLALHHGLYRTLSLPEQQAYDRVSPPKIIQRLWRVKWTVLERLTLPISYRDRPAFLQFAQRLAAIDDKVLTA